MAKITIAGDAVVVTSTMKLEDLKLIKKYRPKELFLKGGEDGKETIFGIAVVDGCGDIGPYGVSFGRESHDESKLATVTMCMKSGAGDIKEVVADEIGYAVMLLGKLEEKLPAVVEDIKAEKTAILNNITVAQ